MKVQPTLFQIPSQPLATNDVSQARRAFEAMLTAGAARNQSPPIRPSFDTLAPTIDNGETASNETQALMARPGRVLDIKV